ETEQRLSAIDASPVHTYQALGRKHTIVAHGAAGTTWLTDPLSDIAVRKLVSGPAIGNQPMGLRIDCWRTTEIATDANTPTRETWGGPSPEAAMAEFNRTAVPPPSLENLASLNDGTQWFPSHLGEKRMNVASMRNEVAASYRMEPIPGPFFGFRPSDIAFAADGTMYVIAMTEGQIWRTTIPPADNPSRVRWQRFATGLDHPIGLQVIDGNRVYVSQKPEITELIDVNGDGVADRHRTVASGWGLSHGWHEYTFGLAADREQNLWFTLNTGYFWTNPGYVNPGRFRGSVMRVDHGTDQLVEVAKGCRVPNGISVGPNGDLFFTDNQGDWIQSCKLAHVVPGRFYGHPETAEDALPEGEFPNGRSTIWLPYEFSRSSSGPVLDDTGSRFGPFSGQMLLGDVGYGANPGIMRISLEKVDGEWQGACFRFTRDEPHGCLRMKFGPDNQLYLASLTTGLTRVRFLGQDPLALQTMAIRPRGEGFVLQLTKPLATSVQLKPEQFHFRRYHYLYTGQYGSPEAGNQDVTVSGVELSANRRTIVLTLPVESHPLGMVYHMTVDNLVSDEGLPLEHNEAWYTVHRISQQP
ncbi:MAG: hypothetical protein O2931_09115, partial [Planctomycetota bacterium]|nr:hypothetical protein [Planctomycetota bacterium]